jgi:hypothetical protein
LWLMRSWEVVSACTKCDNCFSSFFCPFYINIAAFRIQDYRPSYPVPPAPPFFPSPFATANVSAKCACTANISAAMLIISNPISANPLDCSPLVQYIPTFLPSLCAASLIRSIASRNSWCMAPRMGRPMLLPKSKGPIRRQSTPGMAAISSTDSRADLVSIWTMV